MAEGAEGQDDSGATRDVNATDDPARANCSNEYCVSDDQYLDMIRDYIRPSAFEWCLIAFYVAVFALGLVGNALVCFVVWNDRQLRTVTNLFIVNLAVSDLVIIVVCLPPTVLGDVTETWYLGPVMCKIVLYLQVYQRLFFLPIGRFASCINAVDCRYLCRGTPWGRSHARVHCN